MKLNNKSFLIYLSLLAGAILYVSCTAREEESTGEKANSFTNKHWQLQSLTVAPALDWDLDGKKDTDILALTEDCEKDDLLTFKDDGSIVRSSGKVKCDDDEEQEKNAGTWSYDAKSAKLSMKEDGKVQLVTVVEINTKRLELKYQWNTTDGKPHELTGVYIAK